MTDDSTGPAGPLDGDWTLTSYDLDGITTPADRSVPVTATFAGGRVFGKSACNQYSAACLVSGEAIEISMALSTMMFCPPPAMEIEQAFLANLERVAAYALGPDGLTILDGAGRVLLAFAPGIVAPSTAD